MSEAKQIKRVLSGIQPTASMVHLGNYLGAMRHFLGLAENSESLFCIVDFHALTTIKDADTLRNNSLSLAAAYLSIGLDPEKVILYKQSDVPGVTELAWYLACQLPSSTLEKGHAYKDAKASGKSVNAGTMYYPLLMAADILLYKATTIPVGADQKQHIEVARDIAQAFNFHFGEVFPLPDPVIPEEGGQVVGLDGRKMSKSYDNYIGLFEEPKKITKKIKSIVTDSKSVEEPKDPESCAIFKLYKLFGSSDQIDDLAERYRAGGLGYGHAKLELAELVNAHLEPIQSEWHSWMSRPNDVSDILELGAKRASEIAESTLSEVRGKLGVG